MKTLYLIKYCGGIEIAEHEILFENQYVYIIKSTETSSSNSPFHEVTIKKNSDIVYGIASPDRENMILDIIKKKQYEERERGGKHKLDYEYFKNNFEMFNEYFSRIYENPIAMKCFLKEFYEYE
jgi:hypothetical protein